MAKVGTLEVVKVGSIVELSITLGKPEEYILLLVVICYLTLSIQLIRCSIIGSQSRMELHEKSGALSGSFEDSAFTIENPMSLSPQNTKGGK